MEYYIQSLREEIFKHEDRNKTLRQELERQREWVADLLEEIELRDKTINDLRYIIVNYQSMLTSVSEVRTKAIDHNMKLSSYIYYLQNLLTENGIEYDVTDVDCE